MMKAYKRLSILCIAVLLCALLPVLAGATSLEDPPEAVDLNAVYVSVNGDDDGDGSQNSPYATLAKAVEKAAQQESATIYVMSNLTMSECARFWAGDITITSAPGAETPYTIFRGKNLSHIDENESVDPVQDMARGGYNPALIEVGNSASLTLENIILDDGHIMAYTYKGNAPYAREDEPVFVQVDASRGGNATDDDQSNDHLRPGFTMVGTTDVSNFEIVQDAIIATYSGDATITLGNGAVLQNYGGMSAVRVSGGTLVMESGSKICDSDTYTRIKGATDSYGPAGAVWVQSGTVEMQEGSSIENMNGRAIYEDSGEVTINGTISNIVGNADMWQGSNGAAIHIRGNAKGTLNGTISNITGNGSSSVYVVGGDASSKSEFIMSAGSSINTCGTGVKGITMFGNNGTYLYMDGEITGIQQDNALSINMDSRSEPNGFHECVIGPNGNIHDNKVSNGAVYMQTNGGTLDIYGKIVNNINYYSNGTDGRNSCAGLYMAHNWQLSTVTMYEGAEICNNTSGEKTALIVSMGTFTMKGGLISGNIATQGDSGGVTVRNGGKFIMEGGTITNNTSVDDAGGLTFVSENWGSDGEIPYASLLNGTISGNTMNATVSGSVDEGYAVSGGESCDLTVGNTTSSGGHITRYLTVSEDMTLGNPDVYMQKYGFTLLDPQRGTKLGNASADGETALKTASGNLGWEKDKLIASFWAQSASNETWELSGLTKDNAQLPVYALVMPTDPEGNVADGAKAAVYAVTIDGDTWRFAVPAGGTSGYVVGLVQPTEDYGTLALTVSPTQVTEGEDSHTFQYQAVYTISDNLTSLLNQQTKKDDFTLTFVLDNNLTCTDANYDSDTHTLTVTVSADKLDGYTFHFLSLIHI